jgi:alpha-L-rhamnosidase
VNANHPLRSAQWIWPLNTPYMRNTHAEYRRDFRVRSVPKRAPFFITADQCYMLYVNGQYVGRGPARGFQDKWAYDEYDLSAQLVRGHNWLSIRVYNGGSSTFGYCFESRAGLLCAARWKGLTLASDADWPSRVSPAYRADTERVSIQLNFQEQVDTRLDDQAWIRSTRAPKDWPEGSDAQAFGVQPWYALEPRGIPNMGHRVLPYERACTAASGPCDKGFGDTPNVATVLRRELPRATWRPTTSGRVTAGGLPVEMPASGRGKWTAVVVDLGQLSVGTLLVDARGAAGGETVDIHFSEVLNEDGSSHMPSSPHISMAARIVLAQGRTRHELFHMMGHRYAVVVMRNSTRPIRLTLALRETLYPLKIRGSFECGDPVLNDIHRISVRTQQICMLDSYVDTPWREQAQWWGDARVQARNTFHLDNDPRLLVRGVRCIARQSVPNGLTYGHAPTNSHICVLPDFSLIWALTLWDYYHQTGDLDLFREQWPRAEWMLGYFTGEGRGKSGLLQYDERYWLFLDWTDIHKTGTPTLLNLWYLLALEKLAEMADLAGMADETRRLKRLHREQKKLILSTLWDRKKGLFHDGLTSRGKPVRSWSIHNQTLAILCGLQKRHWPAMIASHLLPYLRGRKVAGALPSSYWVTYVYGVMAEMGYGGDVVGHIRRAFAPMIPTGGTWETFDWAPGHGTTSHAWAAHPIYHLAGTLGGVLQTDTAWRRIRFAPVLDLPDVDHGRTVIPTPHGLIRASWRRRDGEADVRLSLPEGVTAEVRLPGLRPLAAAGRQRWTVAVS